MSAGLESLSAALEGVGTELPWAWEPGDSLEGAYLIAGEHGQETVASLPDDDGGRDARLVVAAVNSAPVLLGAVQAVLAECESLRADGQSAAAERVLAALRDAGLPVG